MSLHFLSLPRTEASLVYDNLEEMEQKYRFAYKLSKNAEYADFFGMYDSQNLWLYENADFIIIPFSSSLNSVDWLPKDTVFVNVKGSAGDTPVDYPGYSWIQFFDEVTQYCQGRICTCCSKNSFHDPNRQPVAKQCNDFVDPSTGKRTNLVGGHIIINPPVLYAYRPETVSIPQFIAIAPICQRHNKFDKGYMTDMNPIYVPLINYRIPREQFYIELEKEKNVL